MNLSAVIHSGDKNSWVWKYWKYFYEKYWDFNIPTYFLSEEKPFEWDKVTNILTGSGPWSTTLITSLHKVPTKYIIYMHEDVFLTNTIEFQTIKNIYNTMKTHNLQLVKCCGHDAGWRDAENNLDNTSMIIGDEPLYRYPNNIDYLVSHQVSMWNKDFFKSTLKIGETPWEHELNGTKRLRKRNVPLYVFCSEENEPNARPIPHIEAIRGGKPRTPFAKKLMEKVDAESYTV